MNQYYTIAGLTVEMDTFGRTLVQAKPYAADPVDTPDIRIATDRRLFAGKEEGVSDSDFEHMCTCRSFYAQLMDHGGMLIHSSAVVMDGKAYLFSAASGTGKSTHTGLWQQVFGADRARILNDDKPAVRLENGEWFAYGTPWSGKTARNLNLRVPLAGIAILERGQTNEITRFSGLQAVQTLLTQTLKAENMSMRIKQLDMLDKLIGQVPVWKLKCNMEPEAAVVAYEAMSGEKWRNVR